MRAGTEEGWKEGGWEEGAGPCESPPARLVACSCHCCCPRRLPPPLLQAIWEELQEAVHAVDAMTTRTPQEAGM